jgi:DNA (cytosine-5)-methyltransferase 1
MTGFPPTGSGLTALSLFSGCGGLDLGLSQAGFNIVAGFDAEPLCETAHRLNFPGSSFGCGRIGELTRDRLRDLCPQSADGTLDLLAGGPPCPSFSKSRFYRKDMLRGIDDANGRETIDGYLRVLEWSRPKAFLLENVKGLAYGVHKPALDMIHRRAEDLGYRVSTQVLNAADFGVPQIRERCLVVGIRDGLEFRFPTPTHSLEPSLLQKAWVGAGAVLSDIDTDENADDEGHYAGGRFNDLLKLIPPGDNYLFFTAKRGHPEPRFEWRSRYWSYLLKLDPLRPSWTIQARRSNNMGPFHWRSRILRISEIKRLQTFPDDFEVSGTLEQQWRQIGNAVPPLLAKVVAEKIAEAVMRASEFRNAA